MKTVYLFDLSWHLYRSYYSFQFMSTVCNGINRKTGHIFGVLNSIQEVLSKAPDTEIVLCRDGRPKGKRINSEYKAGREKLDFNIYGDLFRTERLAQLDPRVHIAYNEEVEADEVMFSLSRRYMREGWKVVIYSGDDDMLQALNLNVEIYRGKDKTGEKRITEEFYYNDEHLISKYHKCPIDVLPIYRAIVGDKSDNLEGIPRFPRDLAVKVAVCLGRSKKLVPITGTEAKYIDLLNENLAKLKSNYAIMKLHEIPVEFVADLEDKAEAISDLRMFRLSKWGKFINVAL